MTIDRRGLLIGGGVGLGLLVAWSLWPDGDAALPVPERGRGVDGLLTLAPDGLVTLHSPQVETGQGIWTALAMLVADELGARLADVAVQPLQAGGGFPNPIIEEALGVSLRMTGAATSVRGFALDVRRAAATMRALLLAEAEARTGVDAARLALADGVVTGGARPLRIADLAEEAAARRPPIGGADLREWAAGGIVGTSAPRVDLPSKMRGSWRFASDVRLPQMLHAAARLAPPRGHISRLDRARAAATPGLVELIEDELYVAAVGETGWAADRALAAADVRFRTPRLDAAAVDRALDDALAEGGDLRVDLGDTVDDVAGGATLEAAYRAAPLADRRLEPQAATVRLNGDGGADVWAGSQAPDATRAAVADALGLSVGKVRLVPMGVGGDSGQALECDAAPIAARLAKRLGRPVQLVLSHADGRAMGPLRPPLAARTRARFTSRGISALDIRLASMPGLSASLGRLGAGSAGLALGTAPAPYAIPNQRIAAAAADLPLRTGYHPGGEAALFLFVLESLVDEAARAARAEPLSWRIGMLGSDVRMATLLRRGAERIGWDGGGAGSHMGLACARLDGSRIACFAEVQLEGTAIRVARLVAAVDCGAAINPGLVEQQVAAGMLAGMLDTLSPAPAITNGIARPRSAVPAALADLPRVEVIVMPSDQPPGGVSSLGRAIIAPAIANALAADQGPRLRRLPLSLDDPA